jgi:hypothetical protein
MTGENWVIVAVVSAWLIVQLARILATYRASKRRDEMKARATA